MYTNIKLKEKELFAKLKEAFGYKNEMASPRIMKIVLNVGTGRRARNDKHFNALVLDRLNRITGQKPSIRKAKKSIAGFKIRTGDPVGVMVTLRGSQMHSFFDKLVHIALPRTRDFRGISKNSIDGMGNLTFGIKENSIFPDCAEEELSNVFPLAVTINTSAKNKKEATAFFEELGFPFTK